MKGFLVVSIAVAGMFTLTYLTFFYLAVTGALVVPFLLVMGYLISRRVTGASLPVLAAIVLAPLFSPETFAGWSRILQGQNPGGPNGMLVLIHVAMIVLGSGVLMLGAAQNR